MSSPYMCDVTFVDKVNLKLASTDRIDEWARKELQSWDTLFKIPEGVFSQISGQFYSQFLSLTKGKLERVLTVDASMKVSVLEEMASNYITSKSALGQAILERIDADHYAGVLMYSASIPELWQFSRLVQSSIGNWKNNHYEGRVVAYLKAIFETILLERRIKGVTAADKKSFDIARSDVGALLADYTASLDQHKQQQESQKQDFVLFKQGSEMEVKVLLEGLTAEVEGIKEFYKTELGLQMPVTYWRQKEQDHRKLLRVWSVLFTVAIIALCLAAPKIFQQTLKVVGNSLSTFSGDVGSDMTVIAPWLFFVAVSFPLFLSIWLLRLIAKTLISHQHQMNDASLRVVMTTTFLALVSDNKADEKDRILILNALFHVPSNVNEDGSPPHWFEILQSRMRGGTGV